LRERLDSLPIRRIFAVRTRLPVHSPRVRWAFAACERSRLAVTTTCKIRDADASARREHNMPKLSQRAIRKSQSAPLCSVAVSNFSTQRRKNILSRSQTFSHHFPVDHYMTVPLAREPVAQPSRRLCHLPPLDLDYPRSPDSSPAFPCRVFFVVHGRHIAASVRTVNR